MTLEAIPVHAISTAPGLSGNATALLGELADQVRRLLATGETSTIDLSALPLTPADLDWLRDRLGGGEIAITLQANGESTLDETGCAGVWWVTHRNEEGAITAQFIEVALVPELVKAHPADVALGLDTLESLQADHLPAQ